MSLLCVKPAVETNALANAVNHGPTLFLRVHVALIDHVLN